MYVGGEDERESGVDLVVALLGGRPQLSSFEGAVLATHIYTAHSIH